MIFKILPFSETWAQAHRFFGYFLRSWRPSQPSQSSETYQNTGQARPESHLIFLPPELKDQKIGPQMHNWNFSIWDFLEWNGRFVTHICFSASVLLTPRFLSVQKSVRASVAINSCQTIRAEISDTHQKSGKKTVTKKSVREPNPPGAKNPGSWKSPCNEWLMGSQKNARCAENPWQESVGISNRLLTPCHTRSVRRPPRGPFSYQRLSPRGVRHSPVIEKALQYWYFSVFFVLSLLFFFFFALLACWQQKVKFFLWKDGETKARKGKDDPKEDKTLETWKTLHTFQVCLFCSLVFLPSILCY